MTDYVELKNKLIVQYAKLCYAQIKKHPAGIMTLPQGEEGFLKTVSKISSLIKQYHFQDVDVVLNAIDLSRIYGGVERREKEKPQDSQLQYQDFLVLELLDYFKNDFFKWVSKPSCLNCQRSGNNMVTHIIETNPDPGEDKVSSIERFKCTYCDFITSFRRVNNPFSLLKYRRGRCGEWVNCFMLILKALLGEDSKIRYIWNYEDHVWCEYYSNSLKRWVHLDPCEAAFDQPNLYCDNWGKKMSWVIGIYDGYVMELSNKYITNPEKVIKKESVVPVVPAVYRAINLTSIFQMRNYATQYLGALPGEDLTDDQALKFYYDVILLHKQELKILKLPSSIKPTATISTKGRQTGDSEWTKARGEDGNV